MIWVRLGDKLYGYKEKGILGRGNPVELIIDERGLK